MNETSRCRRAGLMAFYTFLLALGAALPFAASYSHPGVHAQHAPPAHYHVAGYRSES